TPFAGVVVAVPAGGCPAAGVFVEPPPPHAVSASAAAAPRKRRVGRMVALRAEAAHLSKRLAEMREPAAAIGGAAVLGRGWFGPESRSSASAARASTPPRSTPPSA